MEKDKGWKKQKNILSFVLVMALIVVGALGIYFQVMKEQQLDSAVHTPTTEVEKLIAKDLEIGYPETPTEVMKLWGRLNQCIYNSTLEEEEYNSLLKQLRVMYSTELLAQNPEESHSSKLKNEVEEFQNDKGKIVSYSAETGKSIQYKTIQHKECANIRISYFLNRNNEYAKSFQDFILVKEDGKWKILGFKEAETKPATKEDKS